MDAGCTLSRIGNGLLIVTEAARLENLLDGLMTKEWLLVIPEGMHLLKELSITALDMLTIMIEEQTMHLEDTLTGLGIGERLGLILLRQGRS